MADLPLIAWDEVPERHRALYQAAQAEITRLRDGLAALDDDLRVGVVTKTGEIRRRLAALREGR